MDTCEHAPHARRYTSDLVAASAVPGLDLIIGGHSHSFLWPNPDAPPAFFKPENGEDADCCGSETDSTWGPYPTFANKVRERVLLQ
jgi:hypothetical protein